MTPCFKGVVSYYYYEFRGTSVEQLLLTFLWHFYVVMRIGWNSNNDNVNIEHLRLSLFDKQHVSGFKRLEQQVPKF